MKYNKHKIKISSVVYNFLYLGIYQGFNFLFPLIITPFLLHIIGIVNFGILSAVQALMNIFLIIVDYGFNMSGTKEISSNYDNKVIVNNVVNSILCVKVLIIIFAFVLLASLIFFVPQFNSQAILYLLSFALPLGRAFFPVWFFQGMQKMQYLIYFSIISKGLAGIFIYIFIRQPEDYIYVNLIIGSMDLIGSILMLVLIYNNFKYKFYIPIKKDLFTQLKNGFFLFLASFFSMVMSNSYLIILGFFGTGNEIGIYSVSDKIVFFIKQLPVIAFQAIYPYACRTWERSKLAFLKLIKKLYVCFFVILLGINIIVSFFSIQLVSFFTKSEIENISKLFSIMCFVSIIAGLNLPSLIGMLVTNENKTIGIINFTAAALSILIGILLIKSYSYWGALGSMFIVESFITISQFIILLRKYNKLKHSYL